MRPPRDPSADDRMVARLLETAIRRLRTAHALQGAAAGVAVATLWIITGRITDARMPVVALGAALGAFVCGVVAFVSLRHRRTRWAAAARLEAAHPHLQNIMVTAEALLTHPERTPRYMRSHVFAEASRAVESASVERSISLRAPAVVALAATTSLVLVAVMPLPITDHKPAAPNATAPTEPLSWRSGELLIEIKPPAYTMLPAVPRRNPASLEALAGSRAVIAVSAASLPRVRVNGVELAVRSVSGTAIAETLLTESGYLAIDATGRDTTRRLIPITVTPDRAPDVRMTTPGKDLRVPDGVRTISLEAAATDDLALAALEIRYTKISGAGEQFEFQEGTLPIVMSRGSAKDWRGRAQLALAALKMEPGDALVYRAVARDRQPGVAGISTSDTYFVEIAGPGEIALAGFEMPPDRERYLLSQAMIVLKIERLHARERTMTPPAVQEATSNIAAEQHAVRANFIFLLGGEVEDEEQEAESSTEIAEGRFENSARREITLATRLMVRAEQALSGASTGRALPPARDAAKALQRAFGHNRYLLRALPDRTKVDPSRRLSGDVKSAADWLRDLTPPAPDRTVAAARDVLRAALVIGRSLQERSPAQGTAEELSRLAERVLAIAPTDPGMQRASRDLIASREALARGNLDGASTALRRAVPPVLVLSQRGRIDVDVNAPATDRIMGALTMETRR